jgi:hypothetical protein
MVAPLVAVIQRAGAGAGQSSYTCSRSSCSNSANQSAADRADPDALRGFHVAVMPSLLYRRAIVMHRPARLYGTNQEASR